MGWCFVGRLGVLVLGLWLVARRGHPARADSPSPPGSRARTRVCGREGAHAPVDQSLYAPSSRSPSPPAVVRASSSPAGLRRRCHQAVSRCGSGSTIRRAVMEGRSSVMEGDRQNGEAGPNHLARVVAGVHTVTANVCLSASLCRRRPKPHARGMVTLHRRPLVLKGLRLAERPVPARPGCSPRRQGVTDRRGLHHRGS
jgi:hypothetical protein